MPGFVSKGGGNGNNKQSQNHNDGSSSGGTQIPKAAIAAAIGAGFGLLFVGLFTLYRCKSGEGTQGIIMPPQSSHKKSPPEFSVRPPWPLRGVVDQARGRRGSGGHGMMPPPPSATSSSVARLGVRRAPLPVPSVVAVASSGEEERSVDMSTLGDRTAGRKARGAPPPPVQVVRGSARSSGARVRAGGTASETASSQVSSLGSGTIGAGGDYRTLGGFSLEAAIKEEGAFGGDELIGNKIRVRSMGWKEKFALVDLDDSVIGETILNEGGDAQKSKREAMKKIESITAVCRKGYSQKLDREALKKLDSATAVMGNGAADGSFFSKSPSKDGPGSYIRNQHSFTPHKTEVTTQSTPASDSETTPRQSGSQVRGLNIDLEGAILLLNGDEREPRSATYLPRALAGAASPFPPSLASAASVGGISRASSSTWSEVFAGGTAAILSASFAQDPYRPRSGSESDASSGRGLPPNPSIRDVLPPPSPEGDIPPELTVPKILGGARLFPKELTGSRTFPPEFPDSGPLADPPSDASDEAEASEDLVVAQLHTVAGSDPGGRIQSRDWIQRDKLLKGLLTPKRYVSEPSAAGNMEGPGKVEEGHILPGEVADYDDDEVSISSTILPPPPAFPPSSEYSRSSNVVQELPEYIPSELDFGSSIGSIDKISCSHEQRLVNRHNHITRPAKEVTFQGIPYGSDAGISSIGPQSGINMEAAAMATAATKNWVASRSALQDLTPQDMEKYPLEKTNHVGSGEDLLTLPVLPNYVAMSNPRPKLVQSPLTLSTTYSKIPRDAAQQNGDSIDARSASSGSSSGGNPNPWLLDAVTGTLGPRSMSADMESISERSNRSGGQSVRSGRSVSSRGRVGPPRSVHRVDAGGGKVGNTSNASVGSRGSKHSRSSRRSRESQGSRYSAQSITSDLHRLEAQLSALGAKDQSNIQHVVSTGSSSVDDSSGPATQSGCRWRKGRQHL